MESCEHSGKVKVCCRIRPVGTSRDATPINIENRCVHIQTAAARDGSGARGCRRRRRRRDRWGFTFDDVLEDDCSQEEVYRKCAEDILQSVLTGVNGTVMAYGCTGAGKSYTMMGGQRDGGGGICARALRDVYREASRRRKMGKVMSVQVCMSFVEIYNEQLFDLLLSPEAFPPSRNQQQRRFNVYAGNGSESVLDGKRTTPFYSTQATTMEVPGNGGNSGLYTPPAVAGTPQHTAELAIYERPDGSTCIKASRALKNRHS
ncbi:unnamed protein product [Pylaiella littoralis]